VPAVGDSLRDLQAFSDAGCQPILVLTGKGEQTLAASQAPDAVAKGYALPKNTWVCSDLNEAAQRIVFEAL
jgi:D-glycero-D-manno-heptose 1,7-bisphosphate phosphatase